MNNILCVVGPTASGKTRLSVELAKKLDGEILSCDSMQIYKDMDIGTAKPSEEEKQGIVHHMMDFLDPGEDYSVSRYVQQADPILQDILARGKTAIITGGTGLYVDSLILGREFAPFPQTGRREELSLRAKKEGILPLYEELKAIDPEAAARIHPANEKRVIRALEVYWETGKTISQHDRETRLRPPKYAPLWLGLDYENRSALYARIDRRVEEMFALGLVEEVRSLLSRGLSPECTALQAIGYKELVAYFRGEGSENAAKAQIQLSSRRYAKRQRTWFRRNESIHWLSLPDEPDFEAVFQEALALVGQRT